jgi:guanylate kinase
MTVFNHNNLNILSAISSQIFHSDLFSDRSKLQYFIKLNNALTVASFGATSADVHKLLTNTLEDQK